MKLRETTVATAEAPARGPVAAEARVETKAPEHFAEAADEHRKASEAALHKDLASAEAAGARPGAHTKHAFGDIGDKVSGKIAEMKDSASLKKHEKSAESEAKRAIDEEIQSKEAARQAALREAEGKAAGANHGAVTGEFRNGKEIVAVAEVPARGATTGTGVSTSHADDHLVASAKERELAAEAAASKAADEAKLANAHPGAEAKAAGSGIGHKISAKMHEAKEWVSEKVHEKKGDRKEAKAEKELHDDTELAREKAKRAAEAEAAREDKNARAHITNEATTTTVTATRA